MTCPECSASSLERRLASYRPSFLRKRAQASSANAMLASDRRDSGQGTGVVVASSTDRSS